MDTGPLKVLTDTHTLVWSLSNPEALGSLARKALSKSVFTASVVNLWELTLKASKPGALVGDPIHWWEQFVVRQAIPTLPIHVAHIRSLATLPEIHKDPFDRMLIAQAKAEGLAIISKDALFSQYGVRVIW